GITAISAVFFQQKPQKIARQILKSLSDQIKSFSQALTKNRLFQQNRLFGGVGRNEFGRTGKQVVEVSFDGVGFGKH
ncbi:MAG: hypothetical protein ACXW1Z_24150, partial [Methylobacter sp.]